MASDGATGGVVAGWSGVAWEGDTGAAGSGVEGLATGADGVRVVGLFTGAGARIFFGAAGAKGPAFAVASSGLKGAMSCSVMTGFRTSTARMVRRTSVFAVLLL